MNLKQLEKVIEAIIFASGEPIDAERIAQTVETDTDIVINIIDNIKARLDDNDSPIELIRVGDGYQFATRSEYGEIIRKALDYRRKTQLSSAALEVLAVIAYNETVTKAFVEQVRGVDCTGIISSLVEKQLIEEKGRLDIPGRPILYGVTDNFLRCFGLSSLSDLPAVNQQAKDEIEGQLDFVNLDTPTNVAEEL